MATALRRGWDVAGPGAYIRAHRAELRKLLAQRDLAPAMHWGDARRMPWPDGSVQLVVTSPPYPYIAMWDAQLEAQLGLPAGSFEASPGHFDAAHDLLGAVWGACARVLAPGGLLAINIGDATRTVRGEFRCFLNHVAVSARCEALGLPPLVPILWKKPTNKPNAFLGSGFLPSNGYVTLDCEHILLFRKGGKRSFAAKDPLRQASAFSKAERDAWFTQVWQVRGARQNGQASFPEEVPHRLVRMFSALGDAVLDPFAGTGTTLRVARALGRKALGCEVAPALRDPFDARMDAPDPDEVLDALLARYD
ncbi:MAG: site-specific DNA-methyltransferase [Halobacteriales archaeon]|nr:site-specific DNA-methyltransferase [Halobacteriales archaeon]